MSSVGRGNGSADVGCAATADSPDALFARALFAAQAAQLREEVDRILGQHRQDLNGCLDRWVASLQETHLQQPLSPVLLSFSRAGTPQGEATKPLRDAQAVPQKRDELSSPSSSRWIRRPSKLPPLQRHGQKVGPGPSKRSSDDDEKRRKKKATKASHKSMNDLVPTAHAKEDRPQSWIERISSSRYFEMWSGILICLNGIFIGVQSQYIALAAEDAAARNEAPALDPPGGFFAVQLLFTLLFCLELAPRWICSGFLGFFKEDDRWWNAMDVGVVGFGIIDMMMRILFKKSDILGNLSVLRVLRVVRIVRLARVIRIMKFFRELRLMIFSILRSMKALLWVVLVLGMMFYVFGILFTEATVNALDTLDKWQSPDTRDLRLFFGTLDRSILSLFMAMSGGNDWSAYYSVLELLPVQYRVAFLGYISFAIFAVVNIVTGVFVDSAMQSNSEDKVVTAQEELDAKKEYLQAMREVFYELDEDNTGAISVEEFESKLSDERVASFFRAMKLDVSDARKLFWLLDLDKSNEVDIDEFVSGCYQLQGESRSLDVKLMELEVNSLCEAFATFHTMLGDVQKNTVGCQVGSR